MLRRCCAPPGPRRPDRPAIPGRTAKRRRADRLPAGCSDSRRSAGQAPCRRHRRRPARSVTRKSKTTAAGATAVNNNSKAKIGRFRFMAWISCFFYLDFQTVHSILYPKTGALHMDKPIIAYDRFDGGRRQVHRIVGTVPPELAAFGLAIIPPARGCCGAACWSSRRASGAVSTSTACRIWWRAKGSITTPTPGRAGNFTRASW